MLISQQSTFAQVIWRASYPYTIKGMDFFWFDKKRP